MGVSKKSVDRELKNDGERMVPEYHKGNLFYGEHMTRYRQVAQLVEGRTVLDIASGSGYGTKLISASAKKVYGVDVSADAISYAKRHFAAANIEYLRGDGEKIPLDDNSVDAVVSFETIEHIKDYKKFLKEVSRILRDDGIAIISTPNDLEYGEGNHFHLHEFQYAELHDLLKKHFKFVDSYFQSTWRAVMLGKMSAHTGEGPQKVNVVNYDPLQGTDKMLYFYLICSNRKIKDVVEPVLGLGVHLSEAQEWSRAIGTNKYIEGLEQKAQELERVQSDLHKIVNSRAYRVTRFLQKIRHPRG